MYAIRRKRAPAHREIIERARRDLEQGQENTDCREADRPADSHCDVPPPQGADSQSPAVQPRKP